MQQSRGQGIELMYESGYTEGKVGLGLDASAAIGIRLDGSKDKAKNSLMFPLDSDGGPTGYWTRAYPTLKVKYSKSERLCCTNLSVKGFSAI